MHVGLIADWTESAIFITPEVRKLLKVKAGDYLDVKCEAQDTQVSRRICDISTLTFSADSYLYLDPYSFRLLNVDLHTTVVVSPSEYTMEMP